MRWMHCVLALSMALGGACRKRSAWEAREVEPGLVRLDTEHMNLRHDAVGHGKWASRASFVLIDATNTHTEDLMVTLAGELVDDQGAVVGILRPESLRIPAGGVRTFALVDHDQGERAQAAGARVRVLGAHAPGYPPPVRVTDGHVYRDGDRVVVSARVHNTADRPVRVLVLGGFYDRNGRPVRRPFTEMYLPGGDTHPAQFVGPPGSVKGYLFIGDMAY
jgi:hypothetical protein